MPQQAASWTGLETLDLSRNLLRLTTKLTRRDDSTLFTEQHTLKLLGLRRDASEAWTHKDVNAIASASAPAQVQPPWLQATDS